MTVDACASTLESVVASSSSVIPGRPKAEPGIQLQTHCPVITWIPDRASRVRNDCVYMCERCESPIDRGTLRVGDSSISVIPGRPEGSNPESSCKCTAL